MTETLTPPTPVTSEASWQSHGFASTMVKLLAFVIPLSLSVGWTLLLARALRSPSGALETVGWWVVVVGGSIAIAFLAERFTRRLLPMAMLLRLSLVFPETAPSRFGMALRANSVRQLKRRVEDGVLTGESTPQSAAMNLLELSAAISAHDRKTRGHAERVRGYSAMIGQQLKFAPEDLDKLQWGALLHDIGKLDVSADVLNKPSAPNEDEQKALRAHPEWGEAYMAPLRPWLGEWADAASQHHEWYDGTGYPLGLEGEEISLGARIVAVADAFDVMTSTRSYKVAMDPQDARTELLKCSGSQFDPDIVRAFLSIPISQLTRPFQAALGAGALASVSQIIDLRALSAGVAAVTAAIVGSSVAPTVAPDTLAFTEATPTVVEIIEDETLAIPLRTSSRADSFTVQSVDGPATAIVDEDTLFIEPLEEQSGTVTVVLTACDDAGCDTTTIIAEVISVNDPPRAGEDSASTTAGQLSLVIPVLQNDTDAENSELFILRADVAAGSGVVSVVNDGQELLFTPQTGSFGPWSIEYVVTDGGDGFDQGTVTILDGDLAPEAVDDAASVLINQTVGIDVLVNDLDDGGRESLRIIDTYIASPAISGAIVEIDSDSSLNFVAGSTPGVVTVSYTIEDRMQRTSKGEVVITVGNARPNAVDDIVTTEEDTAIVVDVLANDGPESIELDPTTLRVVSSSSGTVTVTADNQIRYEPPADVAGEARVIYEICAGPRSCDTAAIQITVTPVQDNPFAAEGQLQVPANGGPQLIPWVIVSSGQATIVPGTTFSIATDRPELFQAPPAVSEAGALTFTPTPGVVGTANTTITVVDSENGRRVYRLSLLIS